MNIDELIEKIRLESQKDLEKLRHEHEARSASLRHDFEMKRSVFEKEVNSRAEHEAAFERAHMLSTEEVMCRRKSLARKRQILDDAIMRGITAFRASKEYPKFIDALVSRIPDEGIISANKEDSVALSAIKRKKKHARVLCGGAFCAGLTSSVGPVRTILTLESFIEKNKATVEKELAAILFNGVE